MEALLNLKSTTNKFALPGVVQKTSKTDRFIISQMQLQPIQRIRTVQLPFGRLIEGRPR